MPASVPGRHVSFRSSAFPALPDEELQINPGIHGFRLAEFLAQAFRARGDQAGEPWSDDWGWGVSLTGYPFPVTLCCASIGTDEYSVAIDPATSQVRAWFRKYDTAPVIEPIAATLREVLQAHPQIQDITWE